MAHRECANHITLENGKHWCAFDDRPCYVINPRWLNIHDGAIDCDYFLEAVLPWDKELHKAVWNKLTRIEYAPWITDESPSQEEPASKCCASCGKYFSPRSNRQRYCTSCGKENERRKTNARQRKAYAKNKEENLTV